MSDAVPGDPEVSERRPITWTQLREEYGLEAVAHGRDLCGVISFREEEYWRRGLSKTLRVRDAEGVEQQVTLAPPSQEKGEKPAWTLQEEEALQLGAVVELRSPRLHRYLDGEEGTTIESAGALRLLERDVALTWQEKIQMALAMKQKGNLWMAKHQSHRAKTNYQGALDLMNSVGPSAGNTAEEVEEARVLQSVCGSNLMLIGVQEEQWSAVVKAGEEILIQGAMDDIKAKVLYRMALAFSKLGSLDVALEHVIKAKDAATSCQSVSLLPDIDALWTRLRSETTGRRELGGLRQLNWGQVYHLPGMRPKFGYRAPMLLSSSSSELQRVSQRFVDVSKAVALATGKCSLRPRLVYLCRGETLWPDEVHHLEDVLRVKTLVYLDLSLPSSRLLLRDVSFSSPEPVVVTASASPPFLHFLPPDTRALVHVPLLPWLLPAWLHSFLAFGAHIGLRWLAQWILQWILWWLYPNGKGMTQRLAVGGLTALLAQLLSKQENYPVAVMGGHGRVPDDIPELEDAVYQTVPSQGYELVLSAIQEYFQHFDKEAGTPQTDSTVTRDVRAAKDFLCT